MATDHLEPDTVTIPGQNYALINVVSPSSNQKNDTCGLKIKGVFATIDEAKAYAQKLSKMDPTFDVFLVETGKWLPIPPSIEDIEDKKHQDEKLNQIIEEHKNEQIRAQEHFEQRKQHLMAGKVDPIDGVEKTYEEAEPEAEQTEFEPDTKPEKTA